MKDAIRELFIKGKRSFSWLANLICYSLNSSKDLHKPVLDIQILGMKGTTNCMLILVYSIMRKSSSIFLSRYQSFTDREIFQQAERKAWKQLLCWLSCEIFDKLVNHHICNLYGEELHRKCRFFGNLRRKVLRLLCSLASLLRRYLEILPRYSQTLSKYFVNI